MSGRNRALLVVVLICASAASAQSLPDIGEAEIQDLKLLLLDKQGQPRGTLEAGSAKKSRDGRVVVTVAKLNYTRKDGNLELVAKRLEYVPGADAFEAPLGFEATLPDGGMVSVPKGSATITSSATLRLSATGEGEVRFRTGRADAAPFEATIRDPVMLFSFADAGSMQSLSISGRRGAQARARFARLPSLGAAPQGGVLSLQCNAAVSFDMAGSAGTLKMSGRVRALVEQQESAFKLSCATMRLAVLESSGSLQPCELEAAGSARIDSDELHVEAEQVLLSEAADARTAILTRDVRARLWRAGAVLDIRATERVVLRASATSFASGWLEMELWKGATLASWGGGITLHQDSADWLAQGDYVRCERMVPTLPLGPGFTQFDFEIHGRGFAPLISLTGTDAQHPQSLTLAGKSAAGSLVVTGDGQRLGDVRVGGPDILATILGPFHLVRDLRKALGLRPLDSAWRPSDPPGRIVMRAGAAARVNFAGDMTRLTSCLADVQGEVEIRQEPVMRNDRELCTLRGARVELDLNARGLGGAFVEPSQGEVRVTIGFDLLRCAGLRVSMNQNRQVADLTGEGRVVLRDPETLGYFHDALSHVKARTAADTPDAAWMWFGGNGSVVHTDTTQRFEFQPARLIFVRGDFPPPRAGQGAFRDLAELEDSEVSVLYEVRAANLLGAVQLGGEPHDQTLSFALTLTGSPMLHSRQDGLLCNSVGPIRMESTQRAIRDAAGNRNRFLLGSVLCLSRDASVRFENAARYFDEMGRLSGFSYGGLWTLRSSMFLELRFAPAGVELQALQREVARLGRSTPDWATFLDRLAGFEALCAQVSGTASEQDHARLAEVSGLLAQARVALRQALMFATQGREDLSREMRQGAIASEARAFALLGPHYAIKSDGLTDLELRSADGAGLPLKLNMVGLAISFSALGDIRALEAGGPIRVTRGKYVLSGKRLTHDGMALTLDGARLRLPAEIGVEVDGANRIVAHVNRAGTGRLRVYGTQVTIKASLLRPKEER